MGNSKKSTWIGGTAFLAVVIMAMAWFLLVSPVLASADETRAQTEQTEQQNEILRTKVEKLKADFAHLEEYKAELADLQKGIPTTVSMSAYLRQLNDVAAAYGVVVTQITPTNPQAVTLAAAAPGQPTDASGGVSTEVPASDPTPSPSPSAAAGAQDGADGSTAPGAAAVPAGLSAVPVSLIVIGTYQNTAAFLDGLQKTERLFLVGSFTAQAQEENGQQTGRPATELGDVELTVDGFLWVLPDGSLVQAPVDEEEPALPTPGGDRNPFYPIEGTDTASSSSDDD